MDALIEYRERFSYTLQKGLIQKLDLVPMLKVVR